MAIIGYNERVFARGFRCRLHMARFHWCRKIVRDLKIPHSSVLELGCFDGRILEHLPTFPDVYDGYDANWEGGVELGREKWMGKSGVNLHESVSVDHFLRGNMQTYDLSISMETLEHLPRKDIPDYLSKLKHATSRYCLITVPNEVGAVFVAKWLCKKLLIGSADQYTLREFVCQAFGWVDNFAHREHKGFSHRWLISEVEKCFRIIKIEGLPSPWLPLWCNFTIGLVCIRKD